MNYQIKVSKIKELFNPLEDNIFPVDISYDIIEQLLEQHDIFELHENDIARKIAYSVANYEYRELNFVIPDNLDKNNKHQLASICGDSIFDLTAAIYLDESYVVASIEGAREHVKNLLDVDLDLPDNLDLDKNIISDENIVWKIEENIVNYTWGDKEFVLRYWVTGSANIDEKTKAIISFMNPKLWDDSQFLCDLLITPCTYKNSAKFIENIINVDPEILNKPSFFIAAKNNHRMFNLLWLLHYLPIFELSSHSKSSFEKLSYPYFSYERTQELKPLLEDIKVHFLSVEEQVTQLLQSISCYAERGSTLKILEPNVLLTPSILRQLKAGTQNFDIKNAVPIEYIENFEWLKEFFTILGGNLNLNDLKNSGQQRDNLTKFFKSWITDKNKVLEILGAVDSSDIARIYYILPENLKQDKEIIAHLIIKNPSIFFSLPLEQQPDYIEIYIEHATLIEYFPIELFDKIPSRESMKILVGKGYDKWLIHPHLPKDLAYDIDLLMCLPKVDESKLDSQLMKLIEKDNNTITTIMKKCKNLYAYLSKNKQRDCYIALHALLVNYLQVDSTVFNNKGFCVKALEFQPQLVHKIPQPYWNNKDFIMQVLGKIDEGKVDSKILLYTPKELVHLLGFFEISSNYVGFLENYLLNTKLENNLKNKESVISNITRKIKI